MLDREASEKEQARARVWMRLGCGGILCGLCLLAVGAAVGIAAYQSGEPVLYFLFVLLVSIGGIGAIASSGANLYGFVRLLMARVGR